jgi:hypothetical protein
VKDDVRDEVRDGVRDGVRDYFSKSPCLCGIQVGHVRDEAFFANSVKMTSKSANTCDQE